MINKKMVEAGSQKSVIRELAAFGTERAKVVGPENVLNFSIGNPSVPAPQEVQDAIINMAQNWNPVKFHSYSAGNGHEGTRKAIADNLNKRFNTDYGAEDVFMTCGAAASLSITLKSLINSTDDEVIVLAPFFPEYTVWIAEQGAKQVLVEAPEDMQLNLEGIEKAITKHTKAVIINNPNNPSGVIYTREEIESLAKILEAKQEEYGHPIYIITDEPYRELVLVDDAEVAFIPNIYKNTVICYSWSKSLSLPGERIGYILVPKNLDDEGMMAAVAGSARALGYVCAPTLMQFVIEQCIDVEPDVEVYKRNRDLLYNGLTKMGYKVAKPAGGFYLFIEAPNGDAKVFSDKAKEHDMLVVPGAGFGVPSYMRLSFCVETETCEKALPIFEKLMEELKK